MFHLAPVGLQAKSNVKKEKHQEILLDIKAAVRNCTCNRSVEYCGQETEAKDLLRALDAFFSHGFIDPPKAYWRCVREFIPKHAQEQLEIEWQTKSPRKLSVAWLKSTLNQKTMHFQTLSFIGQPKILAKFYDSNGAIRNRPLLKLVAVNVEALNEVDFKFMSSTERQISDIPMAELSLTTPIVHVPSSSAIQPRTIRRKKVTKPDVILAASVHDPDLFSHFNSNILERSIVPQEANEPFLSTTRDQDYIFDALLKKNGRIIQNSRRAGQDSDPDSDNEQNLSSSPKKVLTRRRSKTSDNSPMFSLKPEKLTTVPSEAASTTTDKSEKEFKPEEEVFEEPINSATPLNPFEEEAKSVEETEEEDKPEESNNAEDINEPTSSTAMNSAEPISESPMEVERPKPLKQQVDGEIHFSSGEIVSLAMDIFREDSERFQRIFFVYVNHSTGHPEQRLLLLTDHYVYILKSKKEEPQPQPYSSSLNFASSKFDFSSKTMENMSPILSGIMDKSHDVEAQKYTYTTLVYINLQDLDCISIGLNAQNLLLQAANRKIMFNGNQKPDKQFNIETASEELGEEIVDALQTVVKKFAKKPLAVDRAQTTFSSIILHNFVRKELGVPEIKIQHASLIYWQQAAKEQAKLEPLEAYIFTRNIYPNAWRRKADEWTHSYFLLRERMLYQFTDSTCKEAISSLDLRQKLENIEEVELQYDEKFVFSLYQSDQPTIQFSFETMDSRKKWFTAFELAKNMAAYDELEPVPCLLTMTDTPAILFLQEGENFLADGFVRNLQKLSFKEIFSATSANISDQHKIIILQRESNEFDWIFMRNTSEYQRFSADLKRIFNITIEEQPESIMANDQNYSGVYRQCLQHSNFFTTELVHN